MKSQATSSGAPTTIVDVANAAGVSIKTVSRVVNREPRVSQRTRDKVLKAIEALGYQRNMFARGLRAEKSLVLGLLYENPKGDYPSDILHGALARCRESGYHLQVEVLGGRDMAAQTARFLSETRLDGVFLTPPVCDNADVLATLERFGVPYVRISPNTPHADERYIAIDDMAAADALVDYLANLGHRRIGHIRGMPGHAATTLRLKGYKRALARHGIPFDARLVVDGAFDFASGEAGAARLLGLDDPPTAIFACNDETAAGALSWAHAHDIDVPGRLSICGFDGGTISRVVWPLLTTVMQPIRELGDTAIRTLIGISGGEPDRGAPSILPFELVVGGSTGAPPRASGRAGPGSVRRA